jgi:hypothetical protein
MKSIILSKSITQMHSLGIFHSFFQLIYNFFSFLFAYTLNLKISDLTHNDEAITFIASHRCATSKLTKLTILNNQINFIKL